MISSLRFETSIQLFYFMIAGLIFVIRECNILCVLSLRISLMCLYISRQLPSSCPSLTRITYLSCPVAISVLFDNADPLKKVPIFQTENYCNRQTEANMADQFPLCTPISRDGILAPVLFFSLVVKEWNTHAQCKWHNTGRLKIGSTGVPGSSYIVIRAPDKEKLKITIPGCCSLTMYQLIFFN